jgi:hypothetical protein
MPRQIPKSPAEIVRLLTRTMSASGDAGEINEEDLALLCLGRIDEIPAEARARLLQKISADPQAGEVIAELRQMGWGAEVRIADPAMLTLRIGSWAWAAAACLAIALGVWRLAAPPGNLPNPPANPPAYVQTIPQPENPANATAPRPQPAPPPQPNPAPAQSIPARDSALVVTMILAALLSIPTVYYIRLRRLMRRGQLD